MQRIHENDTMEADERLEAALHLRVPDRVPVSPLIYYFAARHAGMNYADLYSPAKYNQALDQCFSELGPWDAVYPLNFYYPEINSFLFPMKVLEPGRELPEDSIRQFLEEEVMLFDDYDWIVRTSARNPRLVHLRLFLEKWIPRIHDHIGEGWRSYGYMVPRMMIHLIRWRSEFRRWRKKRGLALLYGYGYEAPFDNFSMARGLLNFARDLRNHPEEIRKAAESQVESYVFSMKLACRYMDCNRVMIALHRSSNHFMSPDMFKKISFPSVKRLVERLEEEGLYCVLHCDGDWGLNLETLRELPAGRCIAQFDGATDIFRAKEIIGDRICIYGDVPADLLTLGSPDEVDEYCHRLIEEVGRGGGFILGSGCELAPTAKPENVKVMMDAVRKYGYYDSSARPHIV